MEEDSRQRNSTYKGPGVWQGWNPEGSSGVAGSMAGKGDCRVGRVEKEPEPDLRGARWSLWGLRVYSEDSGLQHCKRNTDTVAL